MADQTPEHLFDRAVQLHQEGNLLEAESLYRQILYTNPTDSDAMQMLGMLEFIRGRATAALDLLTKAIQINPTAPDYYCHQGVILAATGKSAEALQAFESAIALEPNFAEAHLGRGKLLQTSGKLQDAAAAFQTAVKLEHDLPEAWEHLTDTLRELDRLDEALAAGQTHLALRPDSPAALAHLAVVQHVLGRYDEAISNFHRALEIDPNYVDAAANLANALYSAWDIPQAIIFYRKSVAQNPRNPRFGSNLLYALHFQDDLSPAEIFDEHLRWAKAHAQSVRHSPSFPSPGKPGEGTGGGSSDESISQPPPQSSPGIPGAGENPNPPRDLSPTRPLRIGYVSPDFRAHSVSYFIENLLAHHNPDRVETFCYSNTLHPDAVTQRLKSLAHHWQDTIALDDDSLANQIRHDQIDILVDLAGHTANSRLLVFARKPAPIQVTYLGYPNTTGLEAMDYRFTDSHADPLADAGQFYTEKLIHLYPTFLSYRPPEHSPDVSMSSANPITFGSLNHLPKINPRVIETWARILQKVPASRLLIKSVTGLEFPPTRRRITDLFAKYAILSDRIILRPGVPSPQDHLKTYHEIDIALDTFPYNGTTTTCESLWMGVPVVTLSGNRHAGRVGASLLSNVGLADLVARDPHNYIELAVQLAGDLPRLRQLRADLRHRMTRSPLLDGKKFARTVEAAYRRMWRTWLQT